MNQSSSMDVLQGLEDLLSAAHSHSEPSSRSHGGVLAGPEGAHALIRGAHPVGAEPFVAWNEARKAHGFEVGLDQDFVPLRGCCVSLLEVGTWISKEKAGIRTIVRNLVEGVRAACAAGLAKAHFKYSWTTLLTTWSIKNQAWNSPLRTLCFAWFSIRPFSWLAWAHRIPPEQLKCACLMLQGSMLILGW
jgi:hypothetical protein